MEKEIDIFVPGRLCLFGEHSDWAGGHRRQNSEIGIGYAIVAPTNQGTYAKVKELKELIFHFISQPFNASLETKLEEFELLKIAESGELFSYVAGVAHEVIVNYQNYDNKGIEINNYKTDLPMKKGLSSSASVCVLTTKAFNEIYNLKWTPRRVMDIAYLGEIATPSRCGRLDQVCVYDKPVLITFDGNKLGVEELIVGEDIYCIIVDLKANKDTKKILTDLNRGFPFPTNEIEEKKHFYFKNINPDIITRAIDVLKKGDAQELGILIKKAQERFDEYLAPSCKEELTAPILHKVLFMKEIQNFIFGGKGVGSGGDGTAQFICKSKEDRKKVKEILTSEGFECLDLDLKKNII